MITRALLPHRSTPTGGIEGVEVVLGDGFVSYAVFGATPFVPPPAPPVRTDGLWRTTCFELFVQPVGGSEYYEINLSPSRAWAAYGFADYRAGMRELASPVPQIVPIEHGIRVAIDLSGLPPRPWRVGLSAVIEAVDGTKSYWALVHGDGPPDFHDPACFVLSVPAAGAA